MMTNLPHQSLPEICDFVRAHCAPWANADRQRLMEYFGWYNSLGLLVAIWGNSHADLHNHVLGVATCRAFDDPADYWTEFVHREWGKFVKPCVRGVEDGRIIPHLALQMVERHSDNGERIYLWHRDVEELGPPKQYTSRQFWRMMDRLA
jgi:hypothetical protein